MNKLVIDMAAIPNGITPELWGRMVTQLGVVIIDSSLIDRPFNSYLTDNSILDNYTIIDISKKI
jgi:hypothetical protein